MRMDFIVKDKTSTSLSGLENATDKGPWYEGTAGERIAVRLSSKDTNGAYAIVESVVVPGCSPPMHLHRNEEEHFVVLAGAYRILIEDKVFDAPVGTLPFQGDPAILGGTYPMRLVVFW
jgi:quercetin dioxygenase-like cupin family protein